MATKSTSATPLLLRRSELFEGGSAPGSTVRGVVENQLWGGFFALDVPSEGWCFSGWLADEVA